MSNATTNGSSLTVNDTQTPIYDSFVNTEGTEVLIVKYPGENHFVVDKEQKQLMKEEKGTSRWGGDESTAPTEESPVASLIASLVPTEKEGKSYPRNILSVVLIYFINSIARKRVISTGSRASARDTSY